MRKEKREKEKKSKKEKRNKEREEFVERRCSGQTWRNPRERTSDFSLDLWAIQLSDSFETRREVVLHGEDNAWTPVFGSFFKLQKVGYFPTRFIFSLKAL